MTRAQVMDIGGGINLAWAVAFFERKRHPFRVDTDTAFVGCSNSITQSSNRNEHYGQSTSVTKILRGMHADKKSGVWPDTLVVWRH